MCVDMSAKVTGWGKPGEKGQGMEEWIVEGVEERRGTGKTGIEGLSL